MAILLALVTAGIGLTILFERHVARNLTDDLDVHLKQLIAGIDLDPEGRLVITRPPADPRFANPLSGLYWQISSDDGQTLRSRSLWDTTLQLPADELAFSQVHRHELPGPAHARVLLAERRIVLSLGGKPTPVRVAVAADTARVSKATSAFARELSAALALLCAVLIIATSIQIGLGLRPLDAVRRGIAAIRGGREQRLPHNAPLEVQPLVDEVNALLDAQDREIERSRSRAADLAHGLKTPLAALAADASRLHERGENTIAYGIEAVIEAMSRHIDRELARVRVRRSVGTGAPALTELAPLIHSLVATLSRTPSGARIAFESRIPDGLMMPFDRVDLAEVLGNLLDNAVRHARSRVRITTAAMASGIAIVIEDDGSGIAEPERLGVLERGVRLDERSGGTGLGLAIVQDVLEAYGAKLVLASSELGGLKAIISPPPARAAR